VGIQSPYSCTVGFLELSEQSDLLPFGKSGREKVSFHETGSQIRSASALTADKSGGIIYIERLFIVVSKRRPREDNPSNGKSPFGVV
jgi:hypothetical protein